MKFRDFLDESRIEKAYNAIYSALEQGNKKFDQDFWGYLESELEDRGLNLGDMTPDDALEELNDKQILKAYKIFSKKYKDLFESFTSKDVMGYDAYIVTDDKEIYSENGEVQKLPKEHDLWANKSNKYRDFLLSKKDAEALAKDLGPKMKTKAIKTQKPIKESKKVPMEYKMGLGKAQRFYGDKHNSGVSKKEFDEDMMLIANRMKLEDPKDFVRWMETQMSFKMEK